MGKKQKQGDGAAPKATNVRAVSFDMGNAYMNMIADGGISLDCRSVMGRISDATRLNDLPFDDVIQLDGTQWVFGQAAYTYAPRTLEDYPATNRYTSGWYRRLFAYGLHRAYGLRLGEEVFYPEVVISIPAGIYANEEIVAQVRQNLSGDYTITTTRNTDLHVKVSPEKLRIIPEGAGAYVSAASIESNSPLNHGLWFVIDVGYLTTDLVAFRDGDYLPDMAASDAAAGMRYVSSAVARKVYADTGCDLRSEEIDPQLTCDTILVNGRAYSIADPRQRALMDLSDRIIQFIQRGSAGMNLAGVLLTGGGAALLRGLLRLPGSLALTIPPDPRRANVLGGFALIGG